MASFQVRGLTANGQFLQQQVEADSREEAVRLASQAGMEVLEISTRDAGHLWWRSRSRFDLALFAHELIALLQAGLSLVEALETLADRQQHAGQDQSVLVALLRRMREGQSFSQALSVFPLHFPELFVASIAASEQTGEMIDALQRYVRHHEQVGALRQKIVSACLYPALLLLVGAVVGLFLLCFLVPRFSRVYEGLETELPWASRVLMKWGAFASDHALGVAVASVSVVVASLLLMANPVVRQFLLGQIQGMRWVGQQLRLMQLSRFYRSLGLLLRGGIPVIKALRMTRSLLPAGLQLNLEQAIQEISRGRSISDAFQQWNLTTSVALRLIRAGERNGQVAEMLEQVATFHDREVAHWIDRFTRIFEPLLMLFIGMVIGGIVILLYLPIFELAGNIR